MSYKQPYKKKKYTQFDQTSVSHQILRLLLGKDLGGVKDDGLIQLVFYWKVSYALNKTKNNNLYHNLLSGQTLH
jgi:hypothetical protein